MKLQKITIKLGCSIKLNKTILSKKISNWLKTMTSRHQSLARLIFFSLIKVKTKLSMNFKSLINSNKSNKAKNRIKEDVKNKALSYQLYIKNLIIYQIRFKVCNRIRIMYLISIFLYQRIVIQIISIKLIVFIINRKSFHNNLMIIILNLLFRKLKMKK